MTEIERIIKCHDINDRCIHYICALKHLLLSINKDEKNPLNIIIEDLYNCSLDLEVALCMDIDYEENI